MNYFISLPYKRRLVPMIVHISICCVLHTVFPRHRITDGMRYIHIHTNTNRSKCTHATLCRMVLNSVDRRWNVFFCLCVLSRRFFTNDIFMWTNPILLTHIHANICTHTNRFRRFTITGTIVKLKSNEAVRTFSVSHGTFHG